MKKCFYQLVENDLYAALYLNKKLVHFYVARFYTSIRIKDHRDELACVAGGRAHGWGSFLFRIYSRILQCK